MSRCAQLGVSLAILAAIAAGGSLPRVAAQDQAFTRPILARARVFPEIGPGVAALKRDSSGRYYVLASPASIIAIYGADGNRVGQIPNANSRGAKIVYAADIDVNAQGRLFVADRGANAVKIFDADGAIVATIPVAAPMSVAALPGNEFAAATLRSEQLVNVFDAQGMLSRSFGELPAAPQRAERNALLSHGRLYGDGAGYIYLVFTDLPDPTLRKYDPYGSAAYEISLPASEFAPPSEARQWTTVTIEKGGLGPPPKPVIRALAVDAETQEVWVAIGDELLHFDKDGNRRAGYHTSTKEGARIEATSILIEHNRILIADDPAGVFDFALPEPRHAAPSAP